MALIRLHSGLAHKYCLEILVVKGFLQISQRLLYKGMVNITLFSFDIILTSLSSLYPFIHVKPVAPPGLWPGGPAWPCGLAGPGRWPGRVLPPCQAKSQAMPAAESQAK